MLKGVIHENRLLVSMENIAHTVSALISQGETLIGVGLLKRFGYILTADFRYDTITLNSYPL